ncbi:MAG TPA: 50S ribosomal protein L1 [Euryarchaeota archaeon]|nr:MAG: 50S ribosomal protein L1 [Thermococci archaeon]RLF96570.1 MAG: 50S ribosomal protein L1 [Thermococci archaeon]HDI10268.1 50S ribosomal protein L1 [Euryarchaeota archaeon]
MTYNKEAILEAVERAIKEAKERKFKQSVELLIGLRDLDLKKPENRINTEVVLPHGRGKEVKVGVIASGDLLQKGKEMGLETISKEDLQKLAEDKRRAKKLAKRIDFFIAQADLMPLVGRFLGPVLGPRGKMPKPVPPVAELTPMVEKLKRTVRMRVKDNPAINLPVGSEDMDPREIAENVVAVLDHLEGILPKGRHNISSIHVKTTMGPSIKVEV